MKIEIHQLLNFDQDAATSAVLIINDFYILLDCGINQKFDLSVYKNKLYLIEKINLVLITHAGIEYNGALPFLIQFFQNKPQILATIPIQRLSFISFFDNLLNKCIPLWHINKVDYFLTFSKSQQIYDQIVKMKFMQKHQIQINGIDLIIQPLGSGHSLGGSIWQIEANCVNIIYMSNFNIKQEHHLDGLDFINLQNLKIDYLIMSNQFQQVDKQQLKFQQVLGKYKFIQEQCFNQNGSVCISLQNNERCLEILIILQNLIQQYKEKNDNSDFQNLKIYFYNNFKNYIDIVKSQLEFMSLSLTDQLNQGNSNPFDFDQRNFEILTEQNFDQGVQTFFKKLKRPYILLTNRSSLTDGIFKEFMNQFLSQRQNRIISIGNQKLNRDSFDNSNSIQQIHPDLQFIIQKINIAQTYDQIINQDSKQFLQEPELVQSTIDSQHDQIQEQEINFYQIQEFPVYQYHEDKYFSCPYGNIKIEQNNDEILDIDNNGQTQINDEEGTQQRMYEFVINPAKYQKNQKISQVNFNCDSFLLQNLYGICDQNSVQYLLQILKPCQVLILNDNDQLVQYDKISKGQSKTFQINKKVTEFFNVDFNIGTLPVIVDGLITLEYDVELQNFEQKMLLQKSQLNQYYLIDNDINVNKWFEFFKQNGIVFNLESNFRFNYKNKVVIQIDDETINLEGIFCKEYYKIRNLLYKLIINN